MFVLSNELRKRFIRSLNHSLGAEKVIVRLRLDGSEPTVEALAWREYWRPCDSFFGRDARLVQRLNRLKDAWRRLLRQPRSRTNRARYCWRYFGLLHHARRIAVEEGLFAEAMPAIRRILGFEAFTVEVANAPDGVAAGVVANRNPIFVLGRLPDNVPHPTPRHVPLIMPANQDAPFYHYRQYTLNGAAVLLFPSVSLTRRLTSFTVIDRFAQTTTNRPDPYADRRANLLARRVLQPLCLAIKDSHRGSDKPACWHLLDLGAGTGHLLAMGWRELQHSHGAFRSVEGKLTCVDSSGPMFGRSYGLSGRCSGLASIDWNTMDYRELLDDARWTEARGPFDFALVSRLCDNVSCFSLELVSPEGLLDKPTSNCLPHRCLAPRQIPLGIMDLEVRTARTHLFGGTAMYQFSLNDYFACMRSAWLDDPTLLSTPGWVLPIRRFNPASLVTKQGQSVIEQLLGASDAIVIVDLDLDPVNLLCHKRQFGLQNSAAIHFAQDGVSTEAFHYAITRPTIADQLKGNRLW